MPPPSTYEFASRASAMARFNRARSTVINYPMTGFGPEAETRTINWARGAVQKWVRCFSVRSFRHLTV